MVVLAGLEFYMSEAPLHLSQDFGETGSFFAPDVTNLYPPPQNVDLRIVGQPA